jgi:hypothetical protein
MADKKNKRDIQDEIKDTLKERIELKRKWLEDNSEWSKLYEKIAYDLW